MKLFFWTFLLFISYSSLSQNLLVNGSLEEENICLEYRVNCSPAGWVGTTDPVTSFYKIPDRAYRGNHCMAIIAGATKLRSYRSYLRTQLLCQLRKDSRYLIRFYIKSRHDILDSIGVYFTTTDFLFQRQARPTIPAGLFVVNSSEPLQKGDTNWQKVSFVYTATGNENFFTLGNFSKKNIVIEETGIYLENNFYVFFDDISLTPLNADEQLCDGWQQTKDEIYEFTPRHNFLERYISTYIKRPPEPPVLKRTVVQVIDTIVLPDVLFESGKSLLTKGSYVLLDSLCAGLKRDHVDSLVLEGHTDNTGTEAVNKKLSEERALSAANYIGQKLFLRQHQVIIRGWSSERPVADNRTPSGRQKNRRVEIYVYTRE